MQMQISKAFDERMKQPSLKGFKIPLALSFAWPPGTATVWYE
jgi:hypothetical protein